MNKNFSLNLASTIDRLLTESTHEWQYCFLERGGDGDEIFLSPQELLYASKNLAEVFVETIPNNNIVLLLDHGPKFLIALIACIFAQKTVIPAPLPRFGLHSMRLEKILKVCDDAIVLTHNKNIDTAELAFQKNSLPSKGQILVFESLQNLHMNDYKTLSGFSTDGNAPVVIQFTSGSTGDPKGVLISSNNIFANHSEVALRWKFHRDKTLLNWLPHFHDMGLFGGLFYPLLSGQKIVQMDPLHFIQKPQRWLFALSKFRVNFSGGPAFSYDLCNELRSNMIQKTLDLSNLEVAFCGADYVPTQTMQSFRKIYSVFHLNPQAVIPVYGLAEATLFVAGQPNSQCHEPHIYQGNLTEGCYLGERIDSMIEIRDLGNEKILNDGDIGQICISGKSISQGYYKENDFVNPSLLQSGDLGFIRDKYLFVCGRIKDIIVRHGQNISPSDIEQIAASSSKFLNPHAAAAFQIDSSDGGIILLIEIKKNARADLTDQQNVRMKIMQNLQRQMGITLLKVIFLKGGELMRTSSGKVQRQTVATKFRSGHKFKEVGHADN